MKGYTGMLAGVLGSKGNMLNMLRRRGFRRHARATHQPHQGNKECARRVRQGLAGLNHSWRWVHRKYERLLTNKEKAA